MPVTILLLISGERLNFFNFYLNGYAIVRILQSTNHKRFLIHGSHQHHMVKKNAGRCRRLSLEYNNRKIDINNV